MTAISDDHRTATEACGLLDRSERGRLALSGAGAREFLQGQVSNDVMSLAAGRGCYAALLTPKGKMLADLRILDAGDELLLDTERPALQELFNVLRRFSLGYDVVLHKRTLETGLLSLIGPEADAVAGVSSAGALGPAEHDHAPVEIAGVPARAIRTDVGVDLLVDADRTAELADALVARGARSIDEATAETVRVERGRPRYGVDLDETVIPQEAGLNERAVSFTKGCYVGQETVARLFYRGKPNRRLCGLRLSAPVVTGDEVRLGDKVVGRVGSVVRSPALGDVALGLLRAEAAAGARVTVGGSSIEAVVSELPFTAD